MSAVRNYDILDGPSIEALFDACRYAYSKTIIPIKFVVAIGYTCNPGEIGAARVVMGTRNFKIVGISHEDGSGSKFNLEGFGEAKIDEDGHATNVFKNYHFVAFYNTKTRKGNISFK